MDNEGLMIFIFQAIIALFAFFVVAPCVLNAVSLFTVQKRFAKTMIDLGVVQADVVHKLHPKKEIAGVIISLVVVAAFGYGVWRQAPISYLSGGLPLIVGFLKYRQVVQFNSLTVKRFQNTYRDQMDVKKYNDYVNKTFLCRQRTMAGLGPRIGPLTPHCSQFSVDFQEKTCYHISKFPGPGSGRRRRMRYERS